MDLVSNKEAVEILNSADKDKAQSFLLEGTDGIGKKELAMKFACDLLGNELRVHEGSHPDFLLIERKTDEKTGKQKSEIVVDDARKISAFLSLTPAEGDHRVCIVNPADALNNAAANSILKILEEPPKRSIIILLSHGGYLLPTIRSRCVAIKLKPATDKEMVESLAQNLPDVSKEDRKLLALISSNSLGLAKRIHDNNGLDVSRETLQIFSSFPSYNPKTNSKFVAEVAKSAESWEIFKNLLSWLVITIAKETAKGAKIDVEGHNLNSKLVDFESFLDAERSTTDDIKNAEIYNLDKKQVIADIFQRFSACYG